MFISSSIRIINLIDHHTLFISGDMRTIVITSFALCLVMFITCIIYFIRVLASRFCCNRRRKCQTNVLNDTESLELFTNQKETSFINIPFEEETNVKKRHHE